VKSTWRIITEKKGNTITNQEKIATAFNEYFLSISGSIIPENNNHTKR
jgi:hypothetical protein